MQIPDPKFNLCARVIYNRGNYTVLSRSYNDHEGWLYNLGTVTIREDALTLGPTCPFPTGSRVCYKTAPDKIYLVDGQLLKSDRTVTQVSDWSGYVLAPKFKMGDKLRHNVHGVFTVNRVYWFSSPTEKGCWAYNDNFEHNCTKVTCPFKPGDRIACKGLPEKVGRVAENDDILIDLSAPKDIAGQVIPSHIVVWSQWALEPKLKLPLAVKHKVTQNMGYVDQVRWSTYGNCWEYLGPKPMDAASYEENLIDLNEEISKCRRGITGDINFSNKKIIELFLGEYKNV